MSALAAMGAPDTDAEDGNLRCFICLMDSDDVPTQPSDWVYPSPCSLVAHHDCMMAWVQDCERENRALLCPVCKAAIDVDQPADVVVSAANALTNHARSLAPSILAGMIGSGTLASMGIYGTVAMTVFAGRGAPWRFIHVFDGMEVRLSLSRLSILPLIGPVLVLGYSFGPSTVPVSLPLFGIYGSYLVGYDPGAFMWPPTPQAAVTLFPYLQAAYRALYHELFRDWERELDSKIEGLPEALVDDPIPARPAADVAPAPAAEAEPQNENNNNNDNNDNNNRGVFGFFRDIMDTLHMNYDVEVVVEENPVEVAAGQGPMLAVQMENGLNMQFGIDAVPADGADELPGPGIQEVGPAAAAAPMPLPRMAADDFFQIPAAAPIPEPAPAPEPAAAPAPAPRALRATLSDICINIVTALLMPGISAGMGELLRLALPARLTTMARMSGGWSAMWTGTTRQPTGLLQTQWGRSLVGGCVYIVVRDAFRLYVKYRKSLLVGKRRVRNVKRQRDM